MMGDPVERALEQVGDEYHTLDELYAHRHALLIALMRAVPALAWRSRLHADGTMFDGWFIAGMDLPTGTITYHMPADRWGWLDGFGVRTLDHAPEWDGHTSSDVLQRLAEWTPE